jgi:hypothetical protein
MNIFFRVLVAVYNFVGTMLCVSNGFTQASPGYVQLEQRLHDKKRRENIRSLRNKSHKTRPIICILLSNPRRNRTRRTRRPPLKDTNRNQNSTTKLRQAGEALEERIRYEHRRFDERRFQHGSRKKRIDEEYCSECLHSNIQTRDINRYVSSRKWPRLCPHDFAVE